MLLVCFTYLNTHSHQGKVRDTYDLGDKMVIVTTDRQSAFDRILASVPFKGQVLNQTSMCLQGSDASIQIYYIGTSWYVTVVSSLLI